jgi:hypothetical protein
MESVKLFPAALVVNILQGKPLYMLKDHAHWVTTLALNTDFVLRTGPYDHTSRKPSSDTEGEFF